MDPLPYETVEDKPNCCTARDIGLLVARLPIGLFFLIAGYQKIFKMGPRGFAEKAGGTIPAWLPHSLGHTYLLLLPFAEFLVGLMVTLGLLGRIGATLMALILLSITIAVTGIADPKGGPFETNLVLLGLAAGLAFTGPGAFSVAGLICRPRSKHLTDTTKANA